MVRKPPEKILGKGGYQRGERGLFAWWAFPFRPLVLLCYSDAVSVLARSQLCTFSDRYASPAQTNRDLYPAFAWNIELLPCLTIYGRYAARGRGKKDPYQNKCIRWQRNPLRAILSAALFFPIRNPFSACQSVLRLLQGRIDLYVSASKKGLRLQFTRSSIILRRRPCFSVCYLFLFIYRGNPPACEHE